MSHSDQPRQLEAAEAAMHREPPSLVQDQRMRVRSWARIRARRYAVFDFGRFGCRAAHPRLLAAAIAGSAVNAADAPVARAKL